MNFRRSHLICHLAPFTLAACAFTDTRSVTPEIPAAWKHAAAFPTASAQHDLSRWWKHFEDPTLNRVISNGLANSPDIASAAARIREARARRNEEAASLLPFVGGAAASNSSWLKTRGSSEVSGTAYSADLNASWEVDWLGKNRSRVEAASAQIDAAAENFHRMLTCTSTPRLSVSQATACCCAVLIIAHSTVYVLHGGISLDTVCFVQAQR